MLFSVILRGHTHLVDVVSSSHFSPLPFMTKAESRHTCFSHVIRYLRFSQKNHLCTFFPVGDCSCERQHAPHRRKLIIQLPDISGEITNEEHFLLLLEYRSQFCSRCCCCSHCCCCCRCCCCCYNINSIRCASIVIRYQFFAFHRASAAAGGRRRPPPPPPTPLGRGGGRGGGGGGG